MSEMLILPQWLITSPKEAPKKNWGVRVVDDQIADVAPNAELREKYPSDPIWEAPNDVLSPGFVNTHTHLYGVLAHGIPLKESPFRLLAFPGRFLVAPHRRPSRPCHDQCRHGLPLRYHAQKWCDRIL